MISRRALLAGATATLALAACRRPEGERGVVRVGVMANLTHAPLLAAVISGRLARALAPLSLELKVFRAGPRVAEALLGGAIDVASLGPAALVATHARHPQALRVACGLASGGASFVVAPRARVASAADLRNKALASPQIGSTQDVALRKYLRANGLETKERGGDVTVHALAAADIRAQMMRGSLDGAWLPEPWATRLVGERTATRLIDERDLWPSRRFPTALLAARREFADGRGADVGRVAEIVRAEVARALAPETAAQCEQEAFDAIERLAHGAGPRPLFHDALAWVDFSDDPQPGGVAAYARDAAALGLVPATDCAPMFAT